MFDLVDGLVQMHGELHEMLYVMAQRIQARFDPGQYISDGGLCAVNVSNITESQVRVRVV